VTNFDYAVLPNGDWFVGMQGTEALLDWASRQGYTVTVPEQISDESQLYAMIVRHGLRDVYVIPEVLECDSVKA
jgi:hypothetical protein